jgi:ribose transport system permease protein
MLIQRGATLVYTQGAPRSSLTPQFREISEGSFAGLPLSLYAFALLFIVVWFALRRTAWGRRVYAVGANLRAARLSGQPTMRVEVSVYVQCSLLAAVAGLFLVARLGSGDINAGSGFELSAIAATLIGGTSFGGGRGGVAGTLAGVLLITILINQVSLLALPNFVQLIVRGVVVVLGVALYSRRSSART